MAKNNYRKLKKKLFKVEKEYGESTDKPLHQKRLLKKAEAIIKILKESYGETYTT